MCLTVSSDYSSIKSLVFNNSHQKVVAGLITFLHFLCLFPSTALSLFLPPFPALSLVTERISELPSLVENWI